MKLGFTKDRVVTLIVGVMLGLSAWGGASLYTTATEALQLTNSVNVLMKEREIMAPVTNALFAQYQTALKQREQAQATAQAPATAAPPTQ
jgi:hypothetical protein